MTLISKLTSWFNNKGKVLIALSGGVDSALVAYAAFQELRNRAIAVTANYQSISSSELSYTKKICSEIGITQIILTYDELQNDNFVRNDKNRCYYCKNELGKNLQRLVKLHNINTIVDGTNIDDYGDYRPGIKAIRNNNIRSPLAELGFTKSMIRNTAKLIGLSVHDKPSDSCLSSRIPWTRKITKEKLIRIELSETIIKHETNIKQIRVRDIDGTAKIEVDKDELKLLTKHKLDSIRNKLYLIGFSTIMVDPEGYKPGKLNFISN